MKDRIEQLCDWLALQTEANSFWYVKRLSANDTGASGGHQAGPYFPKSFIFKVFPSLYLPSEINPKISFSATVDSHKSHHSCLTVTWYNNKLRGGTRNETRLTGSGGLDFPLFVSSNTGALTLFSFLLSENWEVDCRIWMCSCLKEESEIQSVTGPVEPGIGMHCYTNPSIRKRLTVPPEPSPSTTDAVAFPTEWENEFPSPSAIFDESISRDTQIHRTLDKTLLHRRKLEYSLFRSVEEFHIMPKLIAGFRNVEEFIESAELFTQRRKSRAGRSLESHVKRLFEESGFVEGTNFDYQTITEGKKKPGFLFPSQAAYQDPSFPEANLRMLAVNSSCKYRWRQVINEADRISEKHFLTLEEGISEDQFKEMTAENVALVVPKLLHRMFPSAIRCRLLSLEAFVEILKSLDG